MERDRSQVDLADRLRSEMKALAIAAVGALEKAEMMDDINQRLFRRGPSELLECIDGEGPRKIRRYKPMVELLLREIVAVGADESLDIVEQRRRIGWALDMSGF